MLIKSLKLETQRTGNAAMKCHPSGVIVNSIHRNTEPIKSNGSLR